MTDDQLGPMAQEAPPDVVRLLAERTELTRQAALRTIRLAEGGRPVDAEHLAWCRQFVRNNPALLGPLSDGTPRARFGEAA